MAVLVQSPPMEFVTELVNGWAEAVHHDPAPTGGRAYPPMKRLVERYGVRFEATADHAELASIAGRAYSIFNAPTAERLVVADGFVADADLRPTLHDAAGLWWTVDPARLAVAHVASAFLLHARSDPLLKRLGTCTAHRCRDAYIDTSQGRTRRFCGERCQTRAKARRRRA